MKAATVESGQSIRLTGEQAASGADNVREGRMRKIIVWMMVSIDGFFEGPDGDLDWHAVDDELHRYFNDQLGAMGGFLDGRVTYELMAEFWPTADQDPSSTEPMVEFARIWREMPKIVYSSTLDAADWNTTISREVDAGEIAALKAQPGGDLVLGGALLAAEFARQDLIDEYRLFVNPIILGRGRALFPEADIRRPLRLVDTKPFGNGVVMLSYQRP